MDITLPPGATAKLAGVPYCPPRRARRRGRERGAAEREKRELSRRQPDRRRQRRRRHGPLAAEDRRQGLPRRSLPGRAALAGRGHAGGRRAFRPRHRRRPRAALRRPGDGPDPRRHRRDPGRLRRRQARHPLDRVNINKDEFTLNGTNCRKFATAGVLKGGGADPTNPAAFSSFGVSDPVQLDGCDGAQVPAETEPAPVRRDQAGQAPETARGPQGARRRRQHRPRLGRRCRTRSSSTRRAWRRSAPGSSSPPTTARRNRSTATPAPSRRCSANRSKARSTCARPTTRCRTWSPTCEGQVDIDLVGRIDSFKGGIRTTFDRVPDVPVSKFVMTLPGGKHGLLVASKNLCKGKVKAIIQFKGQNGKKVNKRPKLANPLRKNEAARKGHSGRSHPTHRSPCPICRNSHLIQDRSAASVFVGRSKGATQGKRFAQQGYRGGI